MIFIPQQLRRQGAHLEKGARLGRSTRLMLYLEVQEGNKGT